MKTEKTEDQSAGYQRLANRLAELVVWYGEECNGDYHRRLERARRALRNYAPEILMAHREAMRRATRGGDHPDPTD